MVKYLVITLIFLAIVAVSAKYEKAFSERGKKIFVIVSSIIVFFVVLIGTLAALAEGMQEPQNALIFALENTTAL